MKQFDLLRVGRVLDRIFLGVVASGVVMMMIWLGFVAHRVAFEPFPTFGGDAQIDQVARWMFLGFVCFWGAWAISFGRRAIRLGWPRPFASVFLSLLPAMLVVPTWYVSLPMLNALLDFSPKIITPVYVQRQ